MFSVGCIIALLLTGGWNLFSPFSAKDQRNPGNFLSRLFLVEECCPRERHLLPLSSRSQALLRDSLAQSAGGRKSLSQLLPPHVTQQERDLLAGLLRFDPTERMRAGDAMRSPLFRDIRILPSMHDPMFSSSLFDSPEALGAVDVLKFAKELCGVTCV